MSITEVQVTQFEYNNVVYQTKQQAERAQAIDKLIGWFCHKDMFIGDERDTATEIVDNWDSIKSLVGK